MPVGAVRERPGAVLRRKRSEPSQNDGLPQNHPLLPRPFLQLKPPPTMDEIPSPPNTQQQRERARVRATGADKRAGQSKQPTPQPSAIAPTTKTKLQESHKNPNNPRSGNNLTTPPTTVLINNRRSIRVASGKHAQRIAASGAANSMQ